MDGEQSRRNGGTSCMALSCTMNHLLRALFFRACQLFHSLFIMQRHIRLVLERNPCGSFFRMCSFVGTHEK